MAQLFSQPAVGGPDFSRRKFLQTCALATAGTGLGALRLRAQDLSPNGIGAPNDFQRIDAHAHYALDTDAGLKLVAELNLKVLNICVFRTENGRAARVDSFRGIAHAHPKNFAWMTSIDSPDFTPDYVERTIRQLDLDFKDGAIGCKVWKNLGLVLKKPSGEFFMIDDPILEPVFKHIEKSGRTLTMHMAEPLDAWLPLNPNSIYYQYYKNHPEYHFYTQKGIPSHAQIMQARDNVVARHPGMRIIGAHFGSLDHDVGEMAKRFDQYPNFFVDSAGMGRTVALSQQNPAKVREFFSKYSDRVMFGTDVVAADQLSRMSADQGEALLFQIKNQILGPEAYYRAKGPVKLRGKEVQGLGLPPALMAKYFSGNAKTIYGI